MIDKGAVDFCMSSFPFSPKREIHEYCVDNQVVLACLARSALTHSFILKGT